MTYVTNSYVLHIGACVCVYCQGELRLCITIYEHKRSYGKYPIGRFASSLENVKYTDTICQSCIEMLAR